MTEQSIAQCLPKTFVFGDFYYLGFYDMVQTKETCIPLSQKIIKELPLFVVSDL